MLKCCGFGGEIIPPLLSDVRWRTSEDVADSGFPECTGISDVFPKSFFAPDLDTSPKVGAAGVPVADLVSLFVALDLAAATFFRISGAPSLSACEVFSWAR